MPAMFTTNKRLLRCYEALNHGSEFKILWDTFRSQIAELWFPYDRTIAMDRRRSQKCVSTWSQTIAELLAICDPRSAIVCDHMETNLDGLVWAVGLTVEVLKFLRRSVDADKAISLQEQPPCACRFHSLLSYRTNLFWSLSRAYCVGVFTLTFSSFSAKDNT